MWLLLCLAWCALGQAAAVAAVGLNVQFYANPVMRGSPVCTHTLANGFNVSLASICPGSTLDPTLTSMRVTGTLAPPTGVDWKRFAMLTGASSWVRLWVDDHRIVDHWADNSPIGNNSAVFVSTPALLPNATLDGARVVAIRVDLMPRAAHASCSIRWASHWGPSSDSVEVPNNFLTPTDPWPLRRELQERVASGWNHWYRHSNLAYVLLPHQVGVEVAFQTGCSSGSHCSQGAIGYSGGLLSYQFPSKNGPAVPVRMGLHSFDGSYSDLSFVPFPVGTVGVQPQSSLNITIETAWEKVKDPMGDLFIRIATNASSETAHTANMTILVNPAIYWGAPDVGNAVGDNELVLSMGDLGNVTVSFSATPVGQTSNGLEFQVTSEDLIIRATIGNTAKPASAVAAKPALAAGRQAVLSNIASIASLSGNMQEAADAIVTAIAWNVNFEPRVGVTCPVSRTFEGGFDFIFFDWDMYFLSLMAGTAPVAAISTSAFEMAVSNLIETTQTRSAYGMVMNKRAAAGSSSSDTNSRTEPLVGSTVVLRIYHDSVGTERQATMEWVIRMLFPTLLEWNQWAWNNRRYNVGQPGGGLLVLGTDNNLPCEGSTIGLNNSQPDCGGFGAAILESGMDNSPMYYHAFNDSKANWDDTRNRVQLYDCQMSSLFVAESRALQDLATILGKSSSVPMLKSQAEEMAKAIEETLWDNSTGIYRQVDASPQRLGFSSAISPTSFYPMLAGIPSPDKVVRMVRDHLTNTSEFCVATTKADLEVCPYALPSISRSNSHFFDNTYWAGRTWGPLNLLIWLGLSHPQYHKIPEVENARAGLVAQSHALLMVEWREHRRIFENYNSTNGVGGDVRDANPFYHWGANLVYIGLREALSTSKNAL